MQTNDQEYQAITVIPRKRIYHATTIFGWDTEIRKLQKNSLKEVCHPIYTWQSIYSLKTLYTILIN